MATNEGSKSARPRTRSSGSASYHHGDLRQALVEVAAELITERGPDGFTLREAARRIGVSHSAPYRHFADKDALLIAVAVAGFEELDRVGRAAMVPEAPARARLRAFGEAYLDFAARHPAQYRVMFGRAITKPTPALREAGGRAFERLAHVVAEILGVSRDAAQDPAMAIMAGVHGLATLALDGMVETAQGRYERLRAVVLDQLERGLQRPARS